jgi:hypothetical protein
MRFTPSNENWGILPDAARSDVVLSVVRGSPHRSETRELAAPPIVALSTSSRVCFAKLLRAAEGDPRWRR